MKTMISPPQHSLFNEDNCPDIEIKGTVSPSFPMTSLYVMLKEPLHALSRLADGSLFQIFLPDMKEVQCTGWIIIDKFL
jgi:hypothetical protein